MTSWPKFDSKKIDEKLEKEFENAMQLIENGLRERDNARIGLRWPLAKAEISCQMSLSKEIQDIIANQLNVKSIVLKKTKGNETEVKLDTKMTRELESEGFAREISRHIQSERKRAGLKKGDLIELTIFGEEEGISLLNENEKFIKERTNSRKLKFVVDKIEKKENVLTIKEKRFSVNFS